MKSYWLRLLLALVVLGIVLQVAYILFPTPRVGCDFSLRMYEVKCILEGVDPYDVWSGAVRHPPYCPLGGAPNAATGEIHAVNAYPPWAYTFLLPLARLPVSVSGALYFLFMLLSLGMMYAMGWRYGRSRFENPAAARWVAAVPLFLLLPSIGSNFQSFNYPLVVLLASLAMVWCLQRNRDVLAGCCWAVAMLKPQIAIIYAIPLLLERRFLTCFVAGAICVIASLPPAFLVGRNPIVMIMEGIRGSSGMFYGCGTLPYVVSQCFSTELGAACGVVLGSFTYLALYFRYLKSRGWIWQIAVAATISTLWTYSQLYNSVLLWPLFVLMAESFWRSGQSWGKWCLSVFVLLFMTRIYTFAHGISMLFPQVLGYSLAWHGHLDSLNSFVMLILVVVFVRTVARHNQKGT